MSLVRDFLQIAWQSYSEITPDAGRIHRLLENRGEKIVNDHVAFRTFDLAGLDRLSLGRIFEAWGYVAQGDLEFREKKLVATWYLHSDPSFPKIFISELKLARCSSELADWVIELASPRLARMTKPDASLFFEPSWDPVTFEDYSRFHAESEYAAWAAAFGIRVNHFTVSANGLRTFSSLPELNDFLIHNGFALNESGGRIKGSPAELLEQSSTQARSIPWMFAGGVRREIPSAYYEFARRYPHPGTDRLFQGFVPASADKIFESTFRTSVSGEPRK